jgi:ATP-binding cassette subfamily B protein
MSGNDDRLLGAAFGIGWQAAPGVLVQRILAGALAAAIPAAIAWLTKDVLDRLFAGSVDLRDPVLMLAVTGVLAAALPHVVQYLDAELRRAVAVTIRRRMSAAMRGLQGLARHEDRDFHGRLTRAAEVGPAGPADVLTSSLGVFQGVACVAAFLATLGVINHWMLLIVLAAALPTLRAEVALCRARARTIARLAGSAQREKAYAQLMVSLEAAKEVRLYGLESLFAGRMIGEMSRIDTGHRSADRRELVAQVLLGAVGAAIAGAGLFWAGGSASVGILSVGDVSVFVAAIGGVQGGLAVAIGGWSHAHHALMLFSHVWEVLNTEPDLPSAGPTRPVPELYTGIEFRDVWFRYADHLPWVLRGASFTLRAGCATAMVGRNGSGKSTVVKLLCRFYDPTHGSIRWDGIDLREFDIEELRSRIGAVFQDFMRYELSAAENIAVGDVAAMDDRQRVVESASWAGVYPALAALPAGFDTMLSQVNGGTEDEQDAAAVLSGGEWQRVALARAMFRRGNSMVILDEPSSGLDPQAEHELQQRLRDLRAGRTSLLISHRLNTVRDADAVVVLSGGTVVESGTHRDLVSRGGRYADLFNVQAIGYGP